jgi:hypothetical protein
MCEPAAAGVNGFPRRGASWRGTAGRAANQVLPAGRCVNVLPASRWQIHSSPRLRSLEEVRLSHHAAGRGARLELPARRAAAPPNNVLPASRWQFYSGPRPRSQEKVRMSHHAAGRGAKFELPAGRAAAPSNNVLPASRWQIHSSPRLRSQRKARTSQQPTGASPNQFTAPPAPACRARPA